MNFDSLEPPINLSHRNMTNRNLYNILFFVIKVVKYNFAKQFSDKKIAANFAVRISTYFHKFISLDILKIYTGNTRYPKSIPALN